MRYVIGLSLLAANRMISVRSRMTQTQHMLIIIIEALSEVSIALDYRDSPCLRNDHRFTYGEYACSGLEIDIGTDYKEHDQDLEYP